jgi:hypothetical protein
MSRRRSFVDPGDRAEIGDDIVFHGNHGNLIRGIVADRAVSKRAGIIEFAGRWVRMASVDQTDARST